MVTFDYDRSRASDRGELPKQFIKALVDSGRFYRTRGNDFLFQVDEDSYVPVRSAAQFEAILIAGDAVSLQCSHELSPNDYFGLYYWVQLFGFLLPRAKSPHSAAVEPVVTFKASRVVRAS